jgi:hypothetical protein
VLALMRRAQARLTERMAAVAAATVGPDDRVGAGLAERLRDRFGQPAEPGPPAADEDFGDESIMRRY